ncbi:kinase-like protein [Mytilinidion resinicola]|uniref:Kinase-like protein n=1 Tax=Mytilinidion resinicola TaxID=574789 RepID=A0A6A6YIK0_9PEZI|nr:kinase-like protein [Mytilinidion resinicola]KAF2808389.1 kinase-like protein [Mytilinidion resinicola]
MGNRRTKKSGADLKKEIEDEMARVRLDYKRDYKETAFVSYDYITRLLTSTQPINKLRDSLRADQSTPEFEGYPRRKGLKNLERDVKQKAPKLYSVLLLVGKPQRIGQLLRDNVTDEIFGQVEGGVGPSCPKKYLRRCRHFQGIAEDFYQMQWHIPPILSDESHQIYPVECFRFPFVAAPEYIARGSFGHVHTVTIAKGHLRTNDYDQEPIVAYKMVKKDDDVTWDKLLREVETIRVRRHDNIVPLLASFSAGRENPLEKYCKKESLHMLFPHTKAGDMKAWLERDSWPQDLRNEEARRTYIFETIQGLVSGVAFIHREIQNRIAFHHDLKPSNILLFERTGSRPMWKICDFGNANLRDRDDTETVKTKDNVFGTYVYKPPEYFVKKEGEQPKHGRPFDVYSLGCVCLDLATILKFVVGLKIRSTYTMGTRNRIPLNPITLFTTIRRSSSVGSIISRKDAKEAVPTS